MLSMAVRICAFSFRNRLRKQHADDADRDMRDNRRDDDVDDDRVCAQKLPRRARCPRYR